MVFMKKLIGHRLALYLCISICMALCCLSMGCKEPCCPNPSEAGVGTGTYYTVRFFSESPLSYAHEVSVYPGKRVPKPAITHEGHAVSGWYKDKLYQGVPFDFNAPVVSDMDLYAKWEPIYTVTFRSAYRQESFPVQKVFHGKCVREPNVPDPWHHYSFIGWFKDPYHSIGYNFNEPVREDHEVYAKWVQSAPVYFDAGRGVCARKSESVELGRTVGNDKLPQPVRGGFDFTGWYKDRECTQAYDSSTDIISSPTTLYAGWKRKAYSVGHRGPSGGWIVYENPYVDAKAGDNRTAYDRLATGTVQEWEVGWKYLEVAPEDVQFKNRTAGWAQSFIWGGALSTGRSASGFGSGRNLTNEIIGVMGDTFPSYAARICVDHRVPGEGGFVYDDWYLPSKEELERIYIESHKVSWNNPLVSSFQHGARYWTSSEVDVDKAYALVFLPASGVNIPTSGRFEELTKNSTLWVRPVRRF